jgi:8-oxo-dGTP diphosphatase
MPALGIVPGEKITVTAAVVERDGRLLVTRRGRGVHLEGYWEFPGGKCEPGESDAACLSRELAEEIGVTVTKSRLLQRVSHEYEDRTIELHFYACEISGDPAPLLDQEIRWVTRSELDALQFPPADEELVRSLKDGTQMNGNSVTSADTPDAS